MFEGIKQKDFLQDNKQINAYKKYENGMKFFAKIGFLNENFLDGQLSMVSEFFGHIMEDLDSVLEKDEIKGMFEKHLSKLNDNLNNFGREVAPSEKFEIRGIIWIIHEGLFISSMIGNTSLAVVKNNKIYYELPNDVYNTGNIDTFSDIVEGNIGRDDGIMFFGLDHTRVLDKKDISDINQILQENDIDILNFISQLLSNRIDVNDLVFISLYYDQDDVSGLYGPKLIQNKIGSDLMFFVSNFYKKHLESKIIKYRYMLVVSILSLVVLVLGYYIVLDMFNIQANVPTVKNEDGTSEQITIASLNQELAYFDRLDQNSNEKSIEYKKLSEKIKYLKSKALRPEDVARFEKILKDKYYEGFNVQYVNNLSENINFQSIYNFTESEVSVMVELVSIEYRENMLIGGKKGSILGAIDDNVRGTSNTYNIDGEVKKCGVDNSKQGLYCVTKDDNILHVSKLGTFQTKIFQKDLSDLDSPSYSVPKFVNNIYDVTTYSYAKNSLYTLSADPENLKDGIYIDRYTSSQGQSDEFNPGIGYKVAGDLGSGQDLKFLSFVLDNVNGSFIVRSLTNRQFYQLWRDAGSIDNIQNIRAIPVQGGDTIEDYYDKDIKILTPETSKFIYIFDKEHQTLTIYKTESPKTNPKFTYSYKMVYIARLKFDLPEPIIDITIPNNSSDKAYGYIMTKKGVYQTNIYELIKQYIQE